MEYFNAKASVMCSGVPARVVVKYGFKLRAASTEAAGDDVAETVSRPPGVVHGTRDRTRCVVGGARDRDGR